jgi:hypothetical protein
MHASYLRELSDVSQEDLELGIISRILAHSSDICFLFLARLEPSDFLDGTARRVYVGLLSLPLCHKADASADAECLFSAEDTNALELIRKARGGANGYPFGVEDLMLCVRELHERQVIRRLNEEAYDRADEAFLREIAEELEAQEDIDEMPW